MRDTPSTLEESVRPGTAGSRAPARGRRPRFWPGRGDVGPRVAPTKPIREAAGLPWVHRRERRYRRSLALSDALVSLGVLALTLAGADDVPSVPVLLVVLPLAFVVLAKLIGLYDRDDLRLHKTTLDESPRVLSVVSQILLAYVAWTALVEGDGAVTPGGRLLEAWAGLFVGLLVARWTTRKLLERWCGPERCLVVGDAAAARDVGLRTTSTASVEVVGHLPIESATLGGDRLLRVVGELQVDRLILVAPSHASPEELHEGIRRSKQSGARVSVLPNTGILTGRTGEVDDLGGTVLLGVHRFRPTRSNAILKRALDLAVGIPVVVATLPLIAVLALWVRLDSPGPAIYRQTRVGRGGRHFRLFKLRSMVADADAQRAALLKRNEAGDGLFKLRDDPRITRSGSVLRRTHLDELPQFWNVVRGDMSLVGPRPLILEEDERIGGLDRLRLGLTPGITGPWQVLGSGERRVPMEDMLKLDYVYVTEWSLWNDVVIMIRTLKLVLGRGGL